MNSCDGAAATAGAASTVVVGRSSLELLGRNGASDIEEGVH